MKKFWYISRDPATVGYHDPKQAFFNRADAKVSAEALCKKTGHEFYVMEAVEMVKQSKPPIEWIEVPSKVEFKSERAKYDANFRKRDYLGRFVSLDY